MGTQVQQLEELLSRVQRNRARMEALGPRGRRSIATAAKSVVVQASAAEVEDLASEPEVADIENPPEVIDLVHRAPASATPDTTIAAATEETDFSGVSVSPVSMEPAPAAPEMAAKRAPAIADETDFSGVSVPSIMPLAPEDVEEVDDGAKDNLAETQELDIAEEAEELELVDTDEASAIAMPEHSIQENKPAPSSHGELVSKTFQSTVSASGPVVAVSGSAPVVSWTIRAALGRAWKLGGRE